MLVINRHKSEIQISFRNTNRFNFLAVEKLDKAFPDPGLYSGTVFVFDFSGISFIDTSGFRYLLFLLSKSREHNFDYRICNLSDEVKELIERIELDAPFDLQLFTKQELCS